MKKIIGILIIFLILVCINTVSAENLDSTDHTIYLEEDNSTNLLIDDTLTENISHNHSQISNVIQKATINAPGGTFTQLQSIINGASSGDTISITGDYTYNSGFSTKGVVIGKNINIEGNGYALNGLNTGRIFNITAGNVYISNLNFINGFSPQSDYYDGGGGAITVGNAFNLIYTINLTVDNCSFNNNGGNSFADVINSFAFNNFTIKNCDFYNSYCGVGTQKGMLSFYCDGSQVGNYLNIINNTFHKNNDTTDCLIYIDRIDKELRIQGNVFDTVDAIKNRLNISKLK